MFYHATSTSQDKLAVTLALRKAYSLSNEVCLALTGLQGFEGVIGDILGERAVKFLRKNHKAQYFGKPIRVITLKVPAGEVYGPILAVGITVGHFDTLANKYPKHHFIFLAESTADLEIYLGKYPSIAI
jgi:hypothetical protein